MIIDTPTFKSGSDQIWCMRMSADNIVEMRPYWDDANKTLIHFLGGFEVLIDNNIDEVRRLLNEFEKND